MAEEMEQQETEESITLQLHHEGRQPSQQEASIESTGKHQNQHEKFRYSIQQQIYK